MKAQPECLSCIFPQVLRTAKLVSDDPVMWEKAIRMLAERVKTLKLEDETPASVSMPVYEIIKEITGIEDPYDKIKKETNAAAKRVLPALEKLVLAAKDPLSSAVHMAAAGNIIDFGLNHDLDMERDILPTASQEFAIDDIEEFRNDIKPGVKVLYLGDNSGEIIFDKVLIEKMIELGAEVTFVVKSGPILNDVTMEDAEYAGITGIAKVIGTGSADLGINWKKISKEFSEHYANADIIISKGHANFETVSGKEGNIYFILKTKCESVARELNNSVGDLVLKHQFLK
jgi:damage-control phosphatase, subfamily I